MKLKKTKTTKSALFMSVLSLVLCFTMLLGSTFAWFTDSVVSGSNVITTGKLDIAVEYTLGDKDENGDFVWKNLDSATDLFQKGLWEPGHTEVVLLKITNNGSLALKYAVNMDIVKETEGKTEGGEDIVLSDILTVSTCTQQYTDGNGNVASGADIFPAMTFNGEGGVDGWIGYQTTATFKEGNVLKSDKQLQPKESDYIAVKVDMPETVGNEANYAEDAAPSIEFAINVLATQYNYENDSFGTDYDAGAYYDALVKVDGNVYLLTADTTLTDEPLVSDYSATEAYTVNGNGYTVTGIASSVDSFQWINGTIPVMSNIFSSQNGAKVTVNDLTFTGTMSAVMLGHYQNATYNNYNTELNNVNVIDAEVVSFSSGISPAVCVYGTAVLNNCTMTGTTLSALDTDPMWPVYDMALVNYSNTVLSDCEIGSIYLWNQAGLTVDSGSKVDTIVVRGNMNTKKYGITVKAGATVDVIDLSNIADKTRVNITVEAGATVGKFVANGVEYASVEAWQNS